MAGAEKGASWRRGRAENGFRRPTGRRNPGRPTDRHGGAAGKVSWLFRTQQAEATDSRQRMWHSTRLIK